MKKALIALAVLLIPLPSIAQQLTHSDREALLEELEQIQQNAQSSVDQRLRVAIRAFESAMTSDKEAVDLYLNCVEKIDFEEMKKKSSEFRQWKRNNSDRLSDSAFELAIRQQLRWLAITLQVAASEDPDHDQLSLKASAFVDSIASMTEELAPPPWNPRKKRHQLRLRARLRNHRRRNRGMANGSRQYRRNLRTSHPPSPPPSQPRRIPSNPPGKKESAIKPASSTTGAFHAAKSSDPANTPRNTTASSQTKCPNFNGPRNSISSKQATNATVQSECSNTSKNTSPTNPPRIGSKHSTNSSNPNNPSNEPPLHPPG